MVGVNLTYQKVKLNLSTQVSKSMERP